MTMTRRQAIVAVMALPLADVRVFGSGTRIGATPGHLRIPLDSWAGITVEYKGQSVSLTTTDIFAALHPTDPHG